MENKELVLILIALLLTSYLIGNSSSLTYDKNDYDNCMCTNQNLSIEYNTACQYYKNEYFSQELNISTVSKPNDKLLKEFFERKCNDEKSLNDVLELAKLLKEDSRINAIEELLLMNKTFVEKFRRQQDVSLQLENYITDVDKVKLSAYSETYSETVFMINIRDSDVGKLYDSNNTELFINSLETFFLESGN